MSYNLLRIGYHYQSSPLFTKSINSYGRNLIDGIITYME
jgi:hypothetical protein